MQEKVKKVKLEFKYINAKKKGIASELRFTCIHNQ